MPDSTFLALFLVGLLGGTHCIGMCGGIVGALSMGAPGRWSMHLAYNVGRILSYGLAGAIAAWLGGASGLYALLTGVMFFVLWQLTVRRIREGGPMGPWLCAGAMSVTLLKLYQPLITW